jgi:hypothetical protein
MPHETEKTIFGVVKFRFPRVVTQFEIGALVLTAGCPLHTQAMRLLRVAKFKLSHYLPPDLVVKFQLIDIVDVIL